MANIDVDLLRNKIIFNNFSLPEKNYIRNEKKNMSKMYCPYTHLKHGSDGCDGTTNQTSRLNHQKHDA